jgi:hypothetical protein
VAEVYSEQWRRNVGAGRAAVAAANRRPLPARKRCPSCEQEKDSGEFYVLYRKLSNGSKVERLSADCRACAVRKKKAREAAMEPEKLRKRKREANQRWYWRNADHARAYQRRWYHLRRGRRCEPQNPALVRAWAERAKWTPFEIYMVSLGALLPRAVLKPHVERMLRAFTDDPIQSLVDRTGVPMRRIYSILNEDSPLTGISLDVVDRLFMHDAVSLDTLVDEAHAWAAKNNDPWPVGYRGSTRILQDLRADVAAGHVEPL